MASRRMDETLMKATGSENMSFCKQGRIFPMARAGVLGLVPATEGAHLDGEIRLREAAAAYTHHPVMCVKHIGIPQQRQPGGGGTMFPVTPTPTHPGDAHLLMGCDHVRTGMHNQAASISSSLSVRKMDPTVWNSDVEWVQLPIGQPHMPAPSSGDEMEEIESSVAMEADLSLLQVKHSMLASPTFYFPDCQALLKDDLLSVIGFPGKVDAEFASKHFWNETDWTQHVVKKRREKTAFGARSKFSIDLGTAAQRALDMDDEGCSYLSHTMSVSGGRVHAANDFIVEHTCSTLPGMSGSPCVRMAAPAKFVAVHISGSGDPDMPYNYAVSVRHPFFAAQYVTHVVPSLTQLSDAAFLECAPDALATLHKYLQFVLTLPEQDASVVSIVDAFMAAHPLL